MRKGSRRILVALLVVGGLLAALLGWRERVAATSRAVSAAPVAAQRAAGPDVPASRAPARADALVGVEAPGDPPDACLTQRTQRLRAVRARLDPGASATTAFDAALLDDLIASLGARERAPHEQARTQALANARWQEARTRWPDDLDIAWYAARTCNPRQGCDREAALRHLLRLDADNAAAWLLALAAAPGDDDPSGYDRLLHRAAQARFNDPRLGTVFLRLWPLLEDARPPPACLGDSAHPAAGDRAPSAEDWTTVEASAMEMAIGFAAYAPVARCDPDPGPLPQSRRQDCISLLRFLADGDTLLERTLSLPLLIRLEGDGPRAQEWRERYRQVRWLTKIGGRLMERAPQPATIWLQGEVDWLQRQADAAGQWPPPRGWLPDDARGRSLILSGRLPPDPR